MGVVVAYRKLSPASRRGGGAVRAWVMLLRRAAERVTVRLQRAARRRCGGVGCGARRLTWAGLCGRGVAAAAPRRISSAVGSYDPANYARNFDDGVWKAEEGISSSWSAGADAGWFSDANVSDVSGEPDSIEEESEVFTEQQEEEFYSDEGDLED